MEKYKKTIKKRISLFSLLILAAAILIIINITGVVKPDTGDDFTNGMLSEIQSGFLFGIVIVFTTMIIRYQIILKDEKKLKIQYNSENDERKKFIRQKAGIPIILFSSLVIFFAGIVAGYFNKTVFYTLIICAVFQLNLSTFVKLYYLKKY